MSDERRTKTFKELLEEVSEITKAFLSNEEALGDTVGATNCDNTCCDEKTCCGEGCCEPNSEKQRCPSKDKIKNSTSYRFAKLENENKEVDLYNAATKLLPELLSYYKTTLHSRESMISILERENELLREKVVLLAGKLTEYEQAAEELLISKTVPAVEEAKELGLVDQMTLLFEEPPMEKETLKKTTEMLRESNLKALSGEKSSSFRRA